MSARSGLLGQPVALYWGLARTFRFGPIRDEGDDAVDDGAQLYSAPPAEPETASTVHTAPKAPSARPHDTRHDDPELAALAERPIELIRPLRQTLPVIVSSPHSGSAHPRAFVEASSLDGATLRRSEDCYVDQMIHSAPAHGAPVLAARFPRAFLDPNREAYELDPDMFDGPLPSYVKAMSPRVRGGLGSIARIVADGQPIYRERLSFEEAEWRIDNFYRPYHRALIELIDETRAKFGFAIVLDCHSMPSIASLRMLEDGGPPPEIVLGDRYGRSCRRGVIRAVEKAFIQSGYIVRRNAPYAGGFITDHYGAPNRGVHTIQIEINRGTYMNEETLAPNTGLERLARDFNLVFENLSQIDRGALKAAR